MRYNYATLCGMFVTLSEHESWCNVECKAAARKWRRTGQNHCQRDKTNACNLKMISLALTKNSLNTDQSSIDRITVQQSLCIRIIFSRVERKSLKFFLAHTWSVHVSPARTNAYSLFWEWNIILSWPGNGSFHLLLGIVRPSSTWQLSLDQRFPS